MSEIKKERPILFSASMVRAILEGNKMQTRRVVKPQPAGLLKLALHLERRGWPVWCFGGESWKCKYGHVGDQLWVREAWHYHNWTEDGMPWIKYSANGETRLIETGIPEEWGERLEEIWAHLSREKNYSIDNAARDRRWRPSIHMPRWASRIQLEITDIRVERLQDISKADAIAEGIEQPKPNLWLPCAEEGKVHIDPIRAYRDLWESINGPGSWDANPWVWVVSFKRVMK